MTRDEYRAILRQADAAAADHAAWEAERQYERQQRVVTKDFYSGDQFSLPTSTAREMDADSSAQWNRWCAAHVNVLRDEFLAFRGKLLQVLEENSRDADADAMVICQLRSEVGALRREIEQLRKRDGYAG